MIKNCAHSVPNVALRYTSTSSDPRWTLGSCMAVNSRAPCSFIREFKQKALRGCGMACTQMPRHLSAWQSRPSGPFTWFIPSRFSTRTVHAHQCNARNGKGIC